jgi:branched-chain amino acid transport system substrate-binding protein
MITAAIGRRVAKLALAVPLVLALVAPGAGADQPPIKVGVVFSFSGAGLYSKMVDLGIAAFQKMHGDTVAGRKIEIIRRDDAYSADGARRQAQELIVQDKVDFLVCCAFTPAALAVMPISTQTKKPLLIINAATSGIMADHPYTSRWGFTEAQTTPPLARWALKNGVKTAYILVADYGPGIDAGKSFEETFTAGGGKIVGSVRVPFLSPDYSSYVLRIKDTHPDAVFVMLSMNGISFLKAFVDTGLAKDTKLLSVADFVTENNLPASGDAAIGVLSSYDYSAFHDSKLNRDFVKAFREADTTGQLLPDMMAAATYDTMSAIYKAVALQNGTLDPDKTMELIKGMKLDSPRGPITIDPVTRDIIQNVYLRKVVKRNGQLINVEFQTDSMVKDPTEH